MTGPPLPAPGLDLKLVGPAADGSVVLTAIGEIDLATAGQLRDAGVTAVAEYRPAILLIDLDRVSFLDLAGVSALIEIGNRARAVGGRVCLRRPQPIVHRVLELTELLEVFGLVATPHGFSATAPS